ncbi:hypothetical protein BD779DRAFT_520478 [Infundibulicybe gibba]|nr:hypothetical protein BD779DRAFT_520478 [Infundibulicybe gibba]
MIEIRKFEGRPTSGRHMVTLKPDVDKAAFITTHHIEPVYNYSIIHSFAGIFDEATLNVLRSSSESKPFQRILWYVSAGMSFPSDCLLFLELINSKYLLGWRYRRQEPWIP